MAFTFSSPPNLSNRATSQNTHHDVSSLEACPGIVYRMPPERPLPQAVESKILSRGIIGKSASILGEITIRKSQDGSDAQCSALRKEQIVPFPSSMSPHRFSVLCVTPRQET